MRRYWFPKAYADRMARCRVLTGILAAGVLLWLSDPSPGSIAAGLPLMLAGLLLRAWAAGHLAKNQQLAQTGPYAHVRNPLYLGTLIAVTGFVIAARRWALGVSFVILFLLAYLPVVEQEEQHLRKLFPEYEAYARQVPMFLPRLRPVARGKFRWELYRKNREYQAVAAFLIGLAVLVWKARS